MSLKTILIAAGALILAILTGLVIYGGVEHKAAIVSKAEENVLKSQLATLTATTAAKDKERDAAITASEAVKQAALKKAEDEHRARLKSDADRDAAIAQTKTLPDDSLSGNINLRIGAGASHPTAAGVFSFTRPGTESTLNYFLTGEAAESARDSAIKEAADNKTAFDSCQDQRKQDALKLVDKDSIIDLTNTALAKSDDAYRHLNNSIFGLKIKTFVEGGIVFSVALTILHLTKIIK